MLQHQSMGEMPLLSHGPGQVELGANLVGGKAAVHLVECLMDKEVPREGGGGARAGTTGHGKDGAHCMSWQGWCTLYVMAGMVHTDDS